MFSFTSAGSEENLDSLFEALKVLRISALLSGEASLRMSLDMGDSFLLVFLCGEGELCRLRSKFLSGELCLDCADRSLALVTVSSEDNFADFAGECSRILVGLPGPMVI